MKWRVGAAADRWTRSARSADERFVPPSRRQSTTLPERERLVLSLYYSTELNLKEIGAVLKVTESRVCQLHGQALLRLKARLANWREQDPART